MDAWIGRCMSGWMHEWIDMNSSNDRADVCVSWCVTGGWVESRTSGYVDDRLMGTVE